MLSPVNPRSPFIRPTPPSPSLSATLEPRSNPGLASTLQPCPYPFRASFRAAATSRSRFANNL